MTLLPVLPAWVMLPLTAAVVLFLGWQVISVRRRNPRRGPGSGRDGVLRGILVLLVVGAALRPGIPGGSAEAATADINVFFVVDTTSSIAAEDYGDSLPRLEGVRADISAIAERLAGARFSLITFDTNAAVRMPLTTDTSALDTSSPCWNRRSRPIPKEAASPWRRNCWTSGSGLPATAIPNGRASFSISVTGNRPVENPLHRCAWTRGWSAGEPCWATGQPRADG
ncbi:VWA domain-containing protein [Pseudarthrobacter sp. CCNWLW207]|uniref:VWA domain-containing protein n=1 Tax=Pseudarthrobacter sp. CCNWLW207 TaxID=3127468 RepID=UPI003077D6FF